MSDIKELLDSLISNEHKATNLPNTKETWTRIANKDSFDELGLGTSELEEFLKNWKADNDYTDI